MNRTFSQNLRHSEIIPQDEPFFKLERSIALQNNMQHVLTGTALGNLNNTSGQPNILIAGGGVGTRKYKFGTSSNPIYEETSRYFKNLFWYLEAENSIYTETPLALSHARKNIGTVNIGNYLACIGGCNADGYSDIIDLFKLDIDDRTPVFVDSALSLSRGIKNPLIVSLGNRIIIGEKPVSHYKFDKIDILSNVDGLQHSTYTFPNSAKRTYSGAWRYKDKAIFFNHAVGEFDIFSFADNGDVVYNTALYEHRTAITEDYSLKLNQTAIVGNYIISIEYLRKNYFRVCKITEEDNSLSFSDIGVYVDHFPLTDGAETSYFNAVSMYNEDGISTAAIFYGGNMSVFYIFTLNDKGELQMNTYNSAFASGRLGCTVANDKIYCLEGNKTNYHLNCYSLNIS